MNNSISLRLQYITISYKGDTDMYELWAFIEGDWDFLGHYDCAAEAANVALTLTDTYSIKETE